ncbi:MAG TPA: hypothetical protein VGE67_05870 [Haloferula sp.]
MNFELPPQPPPDAPEPLADPVADKAWDKWENILLLGVISMLVTAGIILPGMMRSGSGHSSPYPYTDAINSIKQVNLAIIEFEMDYGTYPDASTISAVQAKTGTTLALGSSNSNELFRQLIAAGATKSESVFWFKSSGTPRRPNGRLGSDALAKGECSFTYIAGLSSSSDPAAPLVVAPVIPGTSKFDPKPLGGKAVVLRVDGSVKLEAIDKHGEVIFRGMNLFDPRQLYWHGKTPDIKWPE